MSRATELAELLDRGAGNSWREVVDTLRSASDELRRLDRVNAELVKTLRQIREACGSTWVNKEWIALHAGVAIAKTTLTSATKETT